MVDSVCDKVGRMTETLAISSYKTFTYNMIPIWKRQKEVGFFTRLLGRYMKESTIKEIEKD